MSGAWGDGVQVVLRSFTIFGPPATKKTSQFIATNKRTGRPFIVASATTKGWTRDALKQIAIARAADPFDTGGALACPVNCRALIYRERRIGDATNFYQAIADALETAGVVENDRLIVSWDGSRLLHDKERPRVELELTPAEAA